MKKSHYSYLGIACLLAVILGLQFYKSIESTNYTRSPSPTLAAITPTRTPTSTPRATPVATKTSGSVVLDVPFTSQAPYGVWDDLHEEMCEEATLIMADAWVRGIKLTPAYSEAEIQKLADWGVKNLGTYVSTSARDTARMGEEVYGLNTKIIEDLTINKIKSEIDNGNIVILGMAGRMLGNPYYTPPGPIYHMLLIKGYDATGFITNDDGTRHGESLHYSYQTLINAAHDWSGDYESLYSNPGVAFSVSK